MSILDLKLGGCASVTQVLTDKPTKDFLMTMGICKGAKITLIGYAPGGSPVQIQVWGVRLCIAKSVANKIFIAALP